MHGWLGIIGERQKWAPHILLRRGCEAPGCSWSIFEHSCRGQ